ncbi:uncharacterized protein LOC128883063 isoform X2 [Hylaeus volcanicus]|uniref:uncharacterized protein LOC128883063 isoform X2 n=1 Tax=Hylaeus volcanicus TaxID=313075 RepID=UPI0023B7C407|nr:uncharacterized protein LOC128883063 isoform X2 [Hylaeus volcanicus]
MLVIAIVTTLLLCAVFLFQAFVIDTFLITQLSLTCYIFVGLDGLLLIYIICSVSMELAALRGGIIWLFYSWIVLAKLTLLYWCVFTDASHLIKDAIVWTYFHVDQSLFLTPVIFSIVSFRASCVLYGSSPLAVTLENLLLSLHILNYEELTHVKYSWLRFFSGIFVVTGIFMHSYSFPTTLALQMDIPPKLTNTSFQKPEETMSQSYDMNSSHLPSQADIFLTRKHAALVSLFFVDLPLVVSRITLWVVFPHIFTDHSMLAKNILFIPLQIFRLNQCRLAEKDRAKKLKRQGYVKPNSYWIEGTKQLLLTEKESNHTGTDAEKLREDGTSCRNRKLKDPLHCVSNGEVHYNSYRPSHRWGISWSSGTMCDNDSEENKLRIVTSCDSLSYYSHGFKNSSRLSTKNGVLELENPTLNLSKDEANVTMKTGNFALESPSNSDLHVKKGDSLLTPSEIYQLVRDIDTKKTIPLRGFSFCIIMRKILKCIKMGGRRGMLPLLDDTLLLSYWKQIRLIFPLLIAWTTQMILVSIVVLNTENSTPQQIDFPWKQMSWEHRLIFYVIGISSLLMLTTWWMYTPFVDLMFFLLLWMIRSTCFASTLVVLRDTQFFEVSGLWNFSIKTQPLLLRLLYIPPLLRLLYSLFPIQSALLGRQYIYFWPKNIDQPSATILLHPQNNKGVHTDEKENITTSSLLVFLNCRYALAPASLCQLLIGPDIVKDVRIIDMLLMRSWLETFFLLTIHILVLSRYQSKFCFGLFLTYFILCGIYNIVTQVIRLLSLRRYEIKLTFEHIFKKMHENPIVPMNKTSDNGVLPNFPSVSKKDSHHLSKFQSCVIPPISIVLPPRRFLLSLMTVLDIYQREGYFTSPGQIFLNYF